MPNYRIGCAGWSYRDWVGRVYAPHLPAERWLEAYASLFPLVEVDATFYGLPTEAAVQGWLRRVKKRPDFTFVPKLWRDATHEALPQGRMELALRSVDAFMERVVRPLESAGRLEAVLVQLPPSFAVPHATRPEGPLTHLARLLDALEPGRRRVGVEFRNPSWYEPRMGRLEPRVLETLRLLGVSCVQGDKDGARFTESRTARWSYFRLHGRHPDLSERTRATDVVPLLDDPAEAALRIQASGTRDERTLVVLTHHDDGRSALNAADLMERLGIPRPKLPAAPGLTRLDAFETR